MKERILLYIGSAFGCLNIYEVDGSAMAAPPYVTLHNIQTGKYYPADGVTLNEDEVSYDIAWSAAVTAQMTEGPYALEIYTDSTMTNAREVVREWLTAIVVSPTPGETNGAQE